MKTKLILGALLGATICGSAFADVSVDNRRAFCEQADGFVWVEKTQACIPEKPCESTNESIKNSYCIPAPFTSGDKDFRRYIKNVLKMDIRQVKSENSYYTTDGGYVQFDASQPIKNEKFQSVLNDDIEEIIKSACWSHGYGLTYNSVAKDFYDRYTMKWVDIKEPYMMGLGCFIPENSADAEQECQNVAQEVQCSYEYRKYGEKDEKVCLIICGQA